VTRLDWILLGFIVFAALLGLRRGLFGMALSLLGLLAGALLGARLAPQFLAGHAIASYGRLVGLGAAVAGALLLSAVAALVGMLLRGGLRLLPPLRLLDSFGGLLAGAAAGTVLVWVAAAAVDHIPGQASLHRDVRRSEVIQRLNSIAPPARVLGTLDR